MKTPLKILVLLVLLVPAASLSAYDYMWGARAALGVDFPEIYGSSAGLNTNPVLGAWYKGSWSDTANIEIDGGVGMDGSFIFGADTGMGFSFHGYSYNIYPILDKLAFYGHTGMFSYKAGRQIAADPAGLVTSAPFDGADLTLNLGRSALSVGAGFTGLTFGDSAQYYLTLADSRDDLLAAPRLMEYAEWSLPALMENMNFSVYVLALQDFTGDDVLAEESTEKINPVYLELMVNGFINGSFLYDAAVVGQYASYGDATVLAGLGRLGLSWLPGNGNRLGLEVVSSTGDGWGRGGYVLGNTSKTSLYQYLPASVVSTRGYVIEFEPGNLTTLALFYASRPRETHSWELRATTFLRNVDGPVSSALVSQTSGSGIFLGQELLGSWFWRPKSDFGWDVKFGVVYAGDPIEMDTELQKYWFDKVPVLFRLGFDWSWSF